MLWRRSCRNPLSFLRNSSASLSVTLLFIFMRRANAYFSRTFNSLKRFHWKKGKMCFRHGDACLLTKRKKRLVLFYGKWDFYTSNDRCLYCLCCAAVSIEVQASLRQRNLWSVERNTTVYWVAVQHERNSIFQSLSRRHVALRRRLLELM